jgi:hypothetical protein
MRYSKKILMAFVAIVLSLEFGFCGSQITNVQIQKSVPRKDINEKNRFINVTEINYNQSQKRRQFLRTIVTINNTSETDLSGIVLRYAFYAHVKGNGQNVWTVPFWLEKTRVAKLRPGKNAIKLPPMDLTNYMKTIEGTSYIPDSIKLQVMVEPRKGMELDKNVLETIVPVKFVK